MSARAALLERCTFPPAGTPVNCAVSGGADSLALLVLAASAGCRVTAWYVDHGLRRTGADEAAVVARAAHRYGAAFNLCRVAIVPGPNLEARARAARYHVLPDDVCTGHTADDQAETVLLALLRGAGLDGLAGMRPGPRHPILGLRRSETAALCRDEGLRPVADPTNGDARYRRNRIRHELLPLADDIAQRDAAPLVARAAQLLRSDGVFLDGLADGIDPTDVDELRRSPEVLARRALRGWLARAAGGYPPDAAAIERVLRVVSGERRACEVAGVGRVVRRGRRLEVVRRGRRLELAPSRIFTP